MIEYYYKITISMPINLAKEDVNVGDVVYSWKVKEYEQHDRDRRWYIFMAALAVLLLIFAVWSTNYLFILVIVLFGIILFLHQHQKPMEIDFAITETGIVLGSKYYKFGELESFWLIYNPPAVKTLYFGRKGWIKHRMVVSLYDNDPRVIKHYLGQYIDEDIEQEEEPFSDRLSRIFKL